MRCNPMQSTRTANSQIRTPRQTLALLSSIAAYCVTACGSHADADLAKVERRAPTAVATNSNDGGVKLPAPTSATPKITNPLIAGSSTLPHAPKADADGWKFVIGQFPGSLTSVPVNTQEPLPQGECQVALSLGAQIGAAQGSISYALAGRVQPGCASRPLLMIELNTPHPVRLSGALRCTYLRDRALPIQCTGASADAHLGGGQFQIPLDLDDSKDYRPLRALLSLVAALPN